LKLRINMFVFLFGVAYLLHYYIFLAWMAFVRSRQKGLLIYLLTYLLSRPWQNAVKSQDWIRLCSVLRLRQHSIGYMGDGFYRSKDPTNSIKVLKEMLQRKKQGTKTTKSQIWRYNKTHKKGYTQNNPNNSPSLH